MDTISRFEFTGTPGESKVIECTADDVLKVSGNTLYVFDSNTRAVFPGHYGYPNIVLPPGEGEKNIESLQQILTKAVEFRIGRTGTVVGVGGGVICDMAAFAASIYMRGCRLILVPTTLLAMVDAAVGGKAGIDYGGYKNLVGSFYVAGEVRICPEVLNSLPEEEYITGLAEVIKYALLGERSIEKIIRDNTKSLLSREETVLRDIILASIRMKTTYISEDPLEKGIRAHLNFGHTFAHALESSGSFKGWSHGRAVAWGMVKALQLGNTIGITPPEYARYGRDLIERFGFITDITVSTEMRDILIEAMRHDKKNKSEGLTFVLQTGLGQTLTDQVDEEAVRAVLS